VVTETGSSRAPSTILVTSVVTQSDSAGNNGNTGVLTVIVTQTSTPPAVTQAATTGAAASSASASSSSSAAAALGNTNNGSKTASHGLSPGGVTAIAVVVPVVIVALLVVLGLFLYRRRKQKKTAQEARRKEVEEYGYNPNDDPTLPAVGAFGGESEMAEDSSAGYRGWGNQSVNNRKASSAVPSGFSGTTAPASDNPTLPRVPSSPGNVSTAPLVGGAAAGAGAAALARAGFNRDDDRQYPPSSYNRPAELEGSGVQRGPSNASSTYSTTNHTDGDSTDLGHPDYGYDNNYSQYTPYQNAGVGGFDNSQQPVVRDVNARRNTRVENPSVWPQQGGASISQNF
jgi:hypothetical protein